MTDSGAREPSTDEIRDRIQRYIAEARAVPSSQPPAPTAARAVSDASFTRESSLEEILLKIQRDIADGRPIPINPSSA
jgi:hypothetical protein